MKSRYRNKYFKLPEPLKDTDVKLRQLLQIEGKWYAIIMIGVMWLPDTGTLEFNPERCVVAEVHDDSELKTGPLYNVLLITE